MPAVFEAQQITKDFGSTRALEDVGFDVDSGELVGLLGPNGAGKSTLVKIGCGLIRASSGRATVAGHPAGTTAARRSIGYLAELFRFPGWLTADEVLELHQKLAGSEGASAERAELLELVGLSAVPTRRVAAMSKGMQQRLGLAQALIGDPRLLLLDEPTSALDPAGRRAVRSILEKLRERGLAVLLNSHLLSEIELVCDRVVILQHGRVVAHGAPDDLLVPRGVEIETRAGTRTWPDARRDDVPRLVAELVGKGEEVFAVRVLRPSLEEFYLEAVEGEVG
ncbi:MAG: ABC transporter ATP-binding protein [Actinomycetota bacterium]